MAKVKFVGWIGEVPPWAKPWWQRPAVKYAAMSAAIAVIGTIWVLVT